MTPATLPPATLAAQLNTGEAARIVGVAVHTLRALILSGELPATRLSDGPKARYRLDPRDVQAFLDRRRTA